MSAPDPEKKDDKPSIIVIKRVKKVVHGGHHGGSWKIAYADFVTAMMTFFLLMWLLSMLNKSQLQGISEYFKNPNSRSSQQATESQKKKKNALTAKESAGMNVNSETEKEKEKEKKKDDQKKKEDDKSKAPTTAAQADKTSQAIMKDLLNQLKNDPNLSQYKNALNIKITSQGLKIELKDLQGKPMFSNGQTDFAKYAQGILQWLAPTLNKYPNNVIIVGHTDANPLNRPNYTNWELSSDRAAATRRVLVDSGMDNRKIIRILGAADTKNLQNTSADDDANRRIAIIVLNDEAAKAMEDQ